MVLLLVVVVETLGTLKDRVKRLVRRMSKKSVLLMVGLVVEMIHTPKDEASKENEQETDEWSWCW